MKTRLKTDTLFPYCDIEGEFNSHICLVRAGRDEVLSHAELQVSFSSRYSRYPLQYVGYITGVWTIDKYARRGFAYQVMLRTIKLAYQYQVPTLTLHVLCNNLPAVNLYYKCGFRIHPDWQDANTYLMERKS